MEKASDLHGGRIVKRGTPTHPKTYELASILGVRHVTVLGHLELLFHFTSQYAPEGNIGRYSDKRIAAALEWPGKPEKLIEALVATGWLDTCADARIVVHDWSDHADRTTLQRLARHGKTPIKPTQQDSGNLCTQGDPDLYTPPSLSLSLSHKPEPSRARVAFNATPGWERFAREYRGEVVPDRDARAWVALIESEADQALLFDNLPLWNNSRKGREGFLPTAENFLVKGYWKTKPPPEPNPKTDRERLFEEMENA